MEKKFFLIIQLMRFYENKEKMYEKIKKGYFGLQSKIWKCQYNFKQF